MSDDNVQNDSNEIRILKRTIDNLIKTNEGLKSGSNFIMEAVYHAYQDPPDLQIPKAPKKSKKAKTEEIAALHLSDIHFGKITETYNSGVAEERLAILADKVGKITSVRRNSANINEIHILLGGDMIEGENIFPHQAHLIDQGLFDQACITAPSALARTIFTLMEHFEKIKVTCVVGNHGRNGPKTTRSHPRTNWDRICYHIMQLMLLGVDGNRKEVKNRIEFNISDRFFAVDYIYDWGNLLIHGHEIGGGFAGFPWYGVGKKAWGWIDAVGVPWDYLWLGHFHTHASAVLNHRTFLANGTLESDNEFAQQRMASAGFPCQRLCFFDKNHGIISDHQVFLTDTKDRVPNKKKNR